MSAGGRLEIRRTAVHGNVAFDTVLRSANDSTSAPTLLRIESSTLTANSGRTLLESHDNSRLEAVFSTIAGNFDLERTIRGTVDAGAEPGEIQLVGSILYDPPVDPKEDEMFELDPEVTLVADCLVVPDDAVVPEGPLDPDQVATTDDPQFVDLGQLDLHLSPTSPALDVCAGPLGVVSDLDLDLRGHDLPEVPDRLPGSFFDAGAHEIGPPAPVFADGFESGDTAAWSATTP